MVDLTVYKTFRRPKGSTDEDDYVPWFNLAYGTEIDNALVVVVSHRTLLCNEHTSSVIVLRQRRRYFQRYHGRTRRRNRTH